MAAQAAIVMAAQAAIHGIINGREYRRA